MRFLQLIGGRVDSQGPRQRRLTVRPRLEVLEDRLVPSAEQVALSLAANTASTIPVTQDAVLFWNDVMCDANAIDTTLSPGDQPGPTRAARAFGIVSAAVFDAYNSITHTYTPYLTELHGYESADPTAAISTAANVTLQAMYPQQAARFQDLYIQALATVPDGAAEDQGVALGTTVANNLLAARANDHSNDMMTYTPVDAPGRHGADPENPTQGFLTPNWGAVDPFVISAVEPFRAGPPPALNSTDYTAAYEQVKAIGSDGVHTPTTRTAAQTEIGIFWAYDGAPAMGTPPRLYNQMVQKIALDKDNTLEQNARLFALVNLSLADAGIQCWESKYYYDFWRPIVGIREGDADTNPRTHGDATWTPLGAPLSNGMTKNFTPPFPSYSSGHATFGTATFTAVADFYGTKQISFEFQSDEFNGVTTGVNENEPRPKVTHHFANLDQAITENMLSRVYLGVHWIFDQNAGVECGKSIAEYITSHALLPRATDPGRTLQFVSTGRGLDVKVVIDGANGRIIDRLTGQILASLPSSQIDRVVVIGSSTAKDKIEVILAPDAPILSQGIHIDGGGNRGDKVTVRGTGGIDTVLVEKDRLTLNGVAIYLSGIDQLKLDVDPRDNLRVLEQSLADLILI